MPKLDSERPRVMVEACNGSVSVLSSRHVDGRNRRISPAVRVRSEESMSERAGCSSPSDWQGFGRPQEMPLRPLHLLCRDRQPRDLGDPNGGRATLLERTEVAFAPIDILVNNAVAHALKPVDQWSIEELERYQHVNVWAPVAAHVTGAPRGVRAKKLIHFTLKK